MLIGDTYDIGKISCRLRPDLLLIGHLFGLMDDLQCVSLVGGQISVYFKRKSQEVILPDGTLNPQPDTGSLRASSYCDNCFPLTLS